VYCICDDISSYHIRRSRVSRTPLDTVVYVWNLDDNTYCIEMMDHHIVVAMNLLVLLLVVRHRHHAVDDDTTTATTTVALFSFVRNIHLP